MKYRRGAARGVHIIHLLALIMIVLAGSAMAIDFSFYFAAQNGLQTSSDAAALAATGALYRSTALDPVDKQAEAEWAAYELVDENDPGLILDDGDITFGFVDPATRQYQAEQFETPSADPDYAWSGGYNAVRVAVRRTGDSSNGALPAIMARMFGVRSMDTLAYSVAFMDQHVIAVENGGLRPIYACQAQVEQAWQDGRLENNVITIYGDRMSVDGNTHIPGCPPPGSGNWGFADLRNCGPDVPGSSDTGEWFEKGYNGKVESGRCYSTQSGNFITNRAVEDALDRLIAEKEVILIPVYDTYSGSGSNTNVGISGFVGFVITGYQSNGASKDRHIEGYFTKALCRGICRTSGDSGMAPGGAVVKLRLAGRKP